MNNAHQIEREIALMLRRLTSIRVEVGADDFELERSTYAILCLLIDEGPQRLGHIATTFCLDPSTITRQVQIAERDGFITRTSDPNDGRAFVLDVTPQGRRAVTRSRETRLDALRALLGDWTSNDQAGLLDNLMRFNASMEQMIQQYQQGEIDPELAHSMRRASNGSSASETPGRAVYIFK